MPQKPVYLDERGEPITDAAPVYLDDQGNPIGTAPRPEGKSVGGFLGNVVSSGADFAKNTIQGIPELLKMAADLSSPIGMMRNPDRLQARGEQIVGMLKAVPQMIGDRYGSLEKAGNTLYADPVGALADLSGVLSLGGAVAAKAPALAGKLRAVGSATNPVRAAGPIAKATEFTTAAAVRPLLSPAKATVRQQRAPLEIERTALKEGAVTKGRAVGKLKAAVGKTTKAAEDATAAGVTVPRGKVAQFPKTLDEVENLTPNIRELDDLAALESETLATLPANITPSELLKRRRGLDKAVDTAYRAEERGGYVRSVRDKGQKELGGNMRAELRNVSPAVAESDDLARRLGLVTRALEDANLRPKGIPMTAALGAMGGGYFAGGPAAGAIGAGLGVGRTFPQIPLALGSLPVRGTAAVAEATANPLVSNSALVAALIERLSGGQ